MSIRLNTIDLIRWLDDQYDPTGNLSDAAECLERVTTQRDALLKALKKIAADHAYFSGDTLSYARAAIAKAEEKT